MPQFDALSDTHSGPIAEDPIKFFTHYWIPLTNALLRQYRIVFATIDELNRHSPPGTKVVHTGQNANAVAVGFDGVASFPMFNGPNSVGYMGVNAYGLWGIASRRKFFGMYDHVFYHKHLLADHGVRFEAQVDKLVRLCRQVDVMWNTARNWHIDDHLNILKELTYARDSSEPSL